MARKRSYVLIFDADGTLVDSIERFSYPGVCEVFRQSGVPEPSFEDYCEHFSAPFTEYYRSRGITASREQIYEWYHTKARHAEAPLFADVAPILRILSRVELECTLAVVSAQRSSVLVRQLESVSRHFDLIVGEQEDKAHEISRVREMHTLPSERVLYIGDFCSDVRDARRAGVTSVGITRGRKTRHVLERAGAHHVIDHLEGLLGLLHRQEH